MALRGGKRSLSCAQGHSAEPGGVMMGLSSPVGPFDLCLHTQRAGAALLELMAGAGLATSCFVVVPAVSC